MRTLFLLVLCFFCKNTFSQDINPEIIKTCKEVKRTCQFDYTNKKKITIKSQQMHFNLKKQELTTNKDSLISSDTGEIRADKTKIDFNASKMDLFGNVLLNKDRYFLKSNRATVLEKKNIFHAYGDVKFNYLTYQTTAKRATFIYDKMDVEFYDDVIFKDKTDYLKGDMIIFNIENETIQTKGNAKIKMSKR